MKRRASSARWRSPPAWWVRSRSRARSTTPHCLMRSWRRRAPRRWGPAPNASAARTDARLRVERALDAELDRVEVGLVGVHVLEIDEVDLAVREQRPGVPGRDVQLDHAVAGNAESDDVLDPRPAAVRQIARWCDPDQPLLAAERT